MNKNGQERTPLFDALKKYADSDVITFAVPGHKNGEGIKELREYFGEKVLMVDVNGMEGLDYACNPNGVIKEAEQLLANAYKAQKAFFLVNGTTQGVQTMILSTCKAGDKIIVPRNAHKSTFTGIILSGAIPEYIQPEINHDLGIAMGISFEKTKEVIKNNLDAKSICLLNPTYYGIVSDLKSIIRAAHREGIHVIVDEAHGAHMTFHNDFPLTAMEVGADMSSISMHKTCGAMTQASALLIRENGVSYQTVREFLNLTHTTSASYILMSSLDVARKQISTKGEELLEETLYLSRYAREEINKIPGLYAFGKELIGSPGCFDFDETKLGINVRNLGVSGFEMERILRNEYNIVIELGDLYNILLLITIGDTRKKINYLIDSLKDISKKRNINEQKLEVVTPPNPIVIVAPRDAFYSKKRFVKLEESIGEVSGETVMTYPPGIPVVCPGEKITKEVVEYINILKQQKCEIQGMADSKLEEIRILG